LGDGRLPRVSKHDGLICTCVNSINTDWAVELSACCDA